LGLSHIVFDVFDVFWVRGSNLVLSTKILCSQVFWGPPMTSSKP